MGFPTTYRDNSYLKGCAVPKIFVQSTRDQYGPISELEPLIASLAEPKKLILVHAEDHFFAGALDVLEREIANLVPA